MKANLAFPKPQKFFSRGCEIFAPTITVDNLRDYGIKASMKKTRFFNDNERKWLVIDAKDKILGRLATRIAKILQGKNKPTYSPNFLCGDKVIVVNANYLKFTGNKYETKIYDKYSGYPSGRKEINLKTLLNKNSQQVLCAAVKGMLPKSHLGKMMLKSLKIYREDSHGHQAQNPQKIEV